MLRDSSINRTTQVHISISFKNKINSSLNPSLTYLQVTLNTVHYGKKDRCYPFPGLIYPVTELPYQFASDLVSDWLMMNCITLCVYFHFPSISVKKKPTMLILSYLCSASGLGLTSHPEKAAVLAPAKLFHVSMVRGYHQLNHTFILIQRRLKNTTERLHASLLPEIISNLPCLSASFQTKHGLRLSAELTYRSHEDTEKSYTFHT